MSSSAFSPDWLQRFSDPYAVLGVSAAADDRRILKRYRQLAKQLHPDVQRQVAATHQLFFQQVLPKLVNPSYQRLKQEKSRNEVLATLRFKVRKLTRDQQLQPYSSLAQRLLTITEAEVDLFYEQALEQLNGQQFESLGQFEATTQQLEELNLVFLRRKMGEPVIREKRTGLMAPSRATASPIPSPGSGKSAEKPTQNYADRHFKRAQDYLRRRDATGAIQELKDALKLEPQNSNYHCLIGQAYLLNKLPGMARVHLKQALKFNPKNSVAQKYLTQLQEHAPKDSNSQAQSSSGTGANESAPRSARGKQGLMGALFSRR
jgi:curved DNA-binding protein CbpA